MAEVLSARIAAMIAGGSTKEDVYLQLLTEGLAVDEIADAWEAVTSPPAVVQRESDELGRRTIAIVVCVSVILVAIGVFSFVASNWSAMSGAAKIAVVLGAMLLCHAIGWYLRDHDALPFVSEAVTGLGTIIFGAGIFLVGQIYNLSVIWEDGYLLWLLGALAMAYALGSLTQIALALAIGIAAFFGTMPGLWVSFAGDPFLSTSTVLLVFVTAATAWGGWRLCR